MASKFPFLGLSITREEYNDRPPSMPKLPTPESNSCFSFSSPFERRCILGSFGQNLGSETNLFETFRISASADIELRLESPEKYGPDWLTTNDPEGNIWALCRERSDMFPTNLVSPEPITKALGGGYKQPQQQNINPHEKIDQYRSLNFSQISRVTQRTTKKGTGCNCKKTRCLRLHCKCFNKLGYCSDECMCLDCCNRNQFEEERQFVIDKTRGIFPQAFQSKIEQLDGIGSINNQGCKCKTGCRKNYCDCFKNGVSCSPICRCESCTNTKLTVEPSEVRRRYCPAFRSKDKIVIFEDKKVEVKEKAERLLFLSTLDSKETIEQDDKPQQKKVCVGYQTYKRKKYNTSKSICDIKTNLKKP